MHVIWLDLCWDSSWRLIRGIGVVIIVSWFEYVVAWCRTWFRWELLLLLRFQPFLVLNFVHYLYQCACLFRMVRLFF